MGSFVNGQTMTPCKTCNGIQDSHAVDSGFQVLDLDSGFQSKNLLDSRFRILLHVGKPPRKRSDGLSSFKMLSFPRAKFCED